MNSGGRLYSTRQSFSAAPFKNLPCDLAGGKDRQSRLKKESEMKLKENLVLLRVLFPRQGHRAENWADFYFFSFTHQAVIARWDRAGSELKNI